MDSVEVKIKNTAPSLILGDIIEQAVDAIVNAANPSLMGGGGVDGAIHRAGGPAILEECKQIVARRGPLPTGKAVITTGGRLKARYVIHTVGPIWHGGNAREAELLASSYMESLKLADGHKLTSIAFPSISTGAYGYPLEPAAKVAMDAVAGYLENRPTSLRKVVFVLYSQQAYDAYAAALAKIKTN
jgi:O-acetyl-ADP-ribose deacetylase